MIIFKDVSKIYPPDVVALNNVTFHIRPKEFVSIVGRSGTGKTTLVKILTAEEEPTKGRVIIGGWDVTCIRAAEVPTLRRQIGVVFQDFKLLAKKTVFENIAFALEVCGTDSAKIRDIVPQVLQIVGLKIKKTAIRFSFRAVSSSGWQSRGRSSIGRKFCWRTNRPAIWIRITPMKSCNYY